MKLVHTPPIMESLRNKSFYHLVSQEMYLTRSEEWYKELEFENDSDIVKVNLMYFTKSGMMGKDKTKRMVDRTKVS